jgi:hypothetical protein
MKFDMPYENGCVEVYGEYTKGWVGNQEEPPEDDIMEVLYVLFEGKDVSDIVDYDRIETYFWENKHNL